jgi:ABC-type tungstate transport system permease subunit
VEALRTAALLGEYTLTDKGTYTVSSTDIQSALRIFLIGSDDADDLLLNPARVLRSKAPRNPTLAYDFLRWMKEDQGGQEVVRKFKLKGETLYSTAPTVE